MSVDGSGRRDRGAHSAAGGRRRAPLGWLPWAALALLLLIAGGAFLISRNAGDDGDEQGLDVVDDGGAAATDSAGLDGQDAGEPATTSGATGVASTDPGGTIPTTAASSASTPTTASGNQSNGGQGALVAGSQSLLPVPAEGLATFVGQPVTGTAVRVESVVADEGFWVGPSPTDRVFVLLTPEARTTAGESPFQVAAGQLVNLQGNLIGLSGDPAALGVDPNEGADQLRQQGHLVEALSVALT